LQAAQAKGLYETLDGLMAIGGNIFSASKRNDQQLYGRLIKNAKLIQKGNVIDLTVPVAQSDIDSLIGMIKVKHKVEAMEKSVNDDK
jgi:hypothetical protein